MAILANARFQCEFSVGEAIGSFIIWLLLTIVTLGLASFVAPYYVLSAIINKTWVIDENGRKLAQLRVNFTLAEIVGHVVGGAAGSRPAARPANSVRFSTFFVTM